MINDIELQDLCQEIYLNYSGLESNNIDQLMKQYMTEEQFLVSQKKAVYQQGLLNVYYKFCINHLCKLCLMNICPPL
jgi:hypothetical protein